MNTELVAVPIGPCACDGSPHDEDVIYLRPKLGLAAGTQLQRLIVEANQDRDDSAALTGKVAEAYLLVGVADWNLSNGDGKTLPVTEQLIRDKLLSDFGRSAELADVADSLYMGPVLSPLVKKAAMLSRTSTTDESTSPKRGGRSKRPKPSKPSSTSTSPTAGTETTSR